nr:MAG TPA: hypothetical protein [Caudoviricetes sp.]
MIGLMGQLINYQLLHQFSYLIHYLYFSSLPMG